jgi:hypothetical protein
MCIAKFGEKEHLLEHLIRDHKNSNKNIKALACLACEKVYFRKQLLISHMKKNHPKLSRKCNDCSEEFYVEKGKINILIFEY